jgi:ABC-type Fe3+-hydroxamate transport system substrate-binding protein
MPDLPYKKIVSLVPSLTELLFDLGLKNQIVGRTRFCIHPKDEVENVDIVGGTKNPKLDDIVAMEPDLVVANKEENEKDDIELLQKYTEVRITVIETIEDAILEISSLGKQLGVQKRANDLVDNINHLLKSRPECQPLSVAYFIWKDPWMSVGYDTYIHHVLQNWQLTNVYGNKTRYPKTTLDELAAKNPDVILLSSEPYPFKVKHLDEIRKVCPSSKIELVNGEWFSWYGSRMVPAFEWLNDWRKEL